MSVSVLMTGATGHIGTRLLPALLAADPDIAVRAATPDPPLDSPRVTWSPTDLADPSLDVDALTAGVDEVWHLGAATRWDAPDMNAINAVATGRLIEAAARSGVARFLFTGTLLAYGYRRDREIADGDPLDGPPWFPSRDKFAHYGTSKFLAERAIEHAERGTLQTIVLRLGNVSSPTRAMNSLASYTTAQRWLWSSRTWHVMDADAVCAGLARLRQVDAWPASGSIAYFNLVADRRDCRIGDIVGTAPRSRFARGPFLAVTGMLDRLRSWQRNGPHPRRHGLPHVFARNDRLRALGIAPELFRPVDAPPRR